MAKKKRTSKRYTTSRTRRYNILNFTCKLTDFGTSKKKQMILQFAKLILEHQ